MKELSKKAQSISPSSTLGITAKAKKMRASGIDVVSFGAGEPDFDTPDFIKDAAIKAIKEGFTKYTPSSGIPELKEAIVEKFLKENGLKYEPSQIAVSCGAKHSIFNAIQVLCQEGDEVIIPSPFWVSYPEMVKLSGATSVFVRTEQNNDFKLTKELLLKAITKKTKLIILNSPSNPTGCVYNKKELEMIAEIAVSNDIYVLSDEIYEKLIYGNEKHLSIASLGNKIYELTITVNGVSKTYSMTGWRIGYLAGPVKVVGFISNLQDHSTSNPTSISQKAALAAIKGDQAFLKGIVGEFEKRRDYMVKRLNSIKGFKAIEPKGAFYVFCDISATGFDSALLCEKLLEEAHVALIPGEGFGWPTHVRFSFATSMDNIVKGLERIDKFIKG